MPKVIIDGIETEVPPGTTILKAAQKVGIDIPYFCYHPYLKPAGLCRMCLVEVEKMPKLVPACTTEVMDGMVVKTNTQRVEAARKGMLEYMLINHPLDCPICDQAGECDLQDIAFKYGETTSRFIEEKIKHPTKKLGPLLVHEQNRCILCKRCVRFMREVVGGGDWNVYWRASHSTIGPLLNSVVANRFCGDLVEICPVGAITSAHNRYVTRIWKLDFTQSVCTHCDIGCNLHLGVRDGRLIKVKHKVSYPSPWLCDRGYYAFDFVNDAQRITVPLKRQENKMVGLQWEEVVNELASICKDAGDNQIGAIVSPDLSCEDLFAWKGFVELVGGGRSDYRVFGEDHLPQRTELLFLNQLKKAGSVLVIGEDPLLNHPVLGVTISEGVQTAGLKFYAVASGMEEQLAKQAILHLNCLPGYEDAIAKALLLEIKGEGASDTLLEGSGVGREELKALAEKVKEEKPVLIAGVYLNSSGRKALTEVSKLTGSKYLAMERGSNSRGAYLAGLYDETGIEGILKSAAEGKLKVLFVLGVDLLNTYPNGALVREALANVDTLVVYDLFFTDTAAYADIFLPATSFAEEDGVVINFLWDEQKRRKALKPKGMSKPLWEIASLLSAAVRGEESKTSLEFLRGEMEKSGTFTNPASWEPTEEERPSIKGEGVLARVTSAYYRSARYSSHCKAVAAIDQEPFLAINQSELDGLGLKADGKARVKANGSTFELRVKAVDYVPSGSVLIYGGFENFPLTSLLSGRWETRVTITRGED